MPDVPALGLAVWRNTKTDPPTPPGYYPTDLGILYIGLNKSAGWRLAPNVTGGPQPARWCDPSPPDMSDPLGPLTASDLVLAEAACELVANDLERVSEGRSINIAVYRDAAARLRRALDQVPAELRMGGAALPTPPDAEETER